MITDFVFSSVTPPDSTIALGDVHAQYDLFVQFLDWVRDSGARVILLGDLVDRSNVPGDDLRVLERVYDLMQDPESWGLASCTSLIGNHETMWLNCVDGYGGIDWVRNGGDYDSLEAMRPHAEWVRQLPYYVTVNDTLFTHSGGVYGMDPADFMNSHTNREQFVWSRTAPSKGTGLSVWSQTLKKSVFGHSPNSAMPYSVGDAICIDTCAFDTGVLTAYNSSYDTFHSFTIE